MQYQVTASRKRPKNFQTMVGQEFVAAAISHSLESNTLANAYLFTGPRGVGKTSSARILAASMNCLAYSLPTSTPCGKCSNCLEIAAGSNLDVIEIDGASHTGVNDIREIKEEILFPPNHSRYKIYIIDEVHMLSQGAFNALLKTIEEPPSYVKFIFATTESHKIPATIKSRCQQFNFRLIDLELIQDSLGQALRDLSVEYEEEALFWLAKEAKGSMRDAYTLLDQAIAISHGHMSLAQLKERMGFTGVDELNHLMQLTLNQDIEQALLLLHDFFAKGISAEQLILDLSHYFHALLLIRHGVTNVALIGFPLHNFSSSIYEKLSLDHLKQALSDLFRIYKESKFSLNLTFELELFLTQLAQYQNHITPSYMLEQLRSLKSSIHNQPQTREEIDSNPYLVSHPKGILEKVIENEKVDETPLESKSNHPPIFKVTELAGAPAIEPPHQQSGPSTILKALQEWLAENYQLMPDASDIRIEENQLYLKSSNLKEYQAYLSIKESLMQFLIQWPKPESWQVSLSYDKLELIHQIFDIKGNNYEH